MVRNALVLACFLISFGAFAKDIPSPNKGNRAFVKDISDVLSEEQEINLCEFLFKYFDSTSNQIVVLIEPSLEGDDLFTYTNKVGRAWGIGESDKNNGVLLFIATKDRKTRIDVGYGLEGAITDFHSKEIIEDLLLPEFKKGDYYSGIVQAVHRLTLLASGEYVNTRENQDMPAWLVILLVLLFIFVIIWLSGNDSRTYSSNRPYIGRGGPFIGGGHSGGGGFSGGGFGGFGGGSFGGGGASGSW
jgi:uncharacterized protein